MTIAKCPIWGTEAEILPGYSGRDGIAVGSPRAGGKYFISRSAEINLRNSPESLRVRISVEIARNNALESVLEIQSTTIKGLETQKDITVEARANLLLQYLVRETHFVGYQLTGYVELKGAHFSDDGISGKLEGIEYETTKAGELLAWSGSSNLAEVHFLLDMLVERGAIRRGQGKLIPNMTVTAKGFELLSASASEPDLSQAFVAMWFDPSMIDAYESGIESAVRETGYRPMRIDRKEHVNKIDDEIISEIRKSRFMIADFTSEKDKPRGGVYFEAGFALALGKPVIWTCRQDLIDHIHFDTRQFNHIVWSTPAELHQGLKMRIGAVLGQGSLKF